MDIKTRDLILWKGRALLGPPPGVPDGAIPLFFTADEALRSGRLGVWIRSEYYIYDDEREEALWQQAKEALNL